MNPNDTLRKTIDFGKYKGELWTRLPIGYLRSLANKKDNQRAAMAMAELQRRGTTPDQEVEITNHAVDRASLNFTRRWHKDTFGQDPRPGLYSWLYKKTAAAWHRVKARPAPGEIVRVEHEKIIFVFQGGMHSPILKTVMKKDSNDGAIQ